MELCCCGCETSLIYVDPHLPQQPCTLLKSVNSYSCHCHIKTTIKCISNRLAGGWHAVRAHTCSGTTTIATVTINAKNVETLHMALKAVRSVYPPWPPSAAMRHLRARSAHVSTVASHTIMLPSRILCIEESLPSAACRLPHHWVEVLVACRGHTFRVCCRRQNSAYLSKPWPTKKESTRSMAAVETIIAPIKE